MGGIIPKSGKYKADKEEEKTELERKNIVVREIDHFLRNDSNNRVTSCKSEPDLRKPTVSREERIIRVKTFAGFLNTEEKAASKEEVTHVVLKDENKHRSSTPEVSVTSPTPEIEEIHPEPEPVVEYKKEIVQNSWISVNIQLQEVTAQLKRTRKQMKNPSEHSAKEVATNLDNCLEKITNITSDNEKVKELKSKITGKIYEYKNQLKEREEQLSKSVDQIEYEDVNATPNKQHFESVVEFFQKMTKELDVIKEEIIDYYGTATDQDFINIMEKLSEYADQVKEIDVRGEVRIALTKEQYEDYIERLQKQFEVIAKDNENSFLEHKRKLSTIDRDRNRRKRSRVLDSYAKDLPAEFSGVAPIHEELDQIELTEENQIEINVKQDDIKNNSEEPVVRRSQSIRYERDSEEQVEVPMSPDDQTGLKVFSFDTPESTNLNKIRFTRSNSTISADEFYDCDSDAEDSESAEEIYSDAPEIIPLNLEHVQVAADRQLNPEFIGTQNENEQVEHIFVARGDDNRKRSFNTVKNEYGEKLQRLLSEDMDFEGDDYITNESLISKLTGAQDSLKKDKEDNPESLPTFQYSVEEYVKTFENNNDQLNKQPEILDNIGEDQEEYVRTYNSNFKSNSPSDEIQEGIEEINVNKKNYDETETRNQDAEQGKAKQQQKLLVQIVNETFNTKINLEDNEGSIYRSEETSKSNEEDTIKSINKDHEISRESLMFGREEVNHKNIKKEEVSNIATSVKETSKDYITFEAEKDINLAQNETTQTNEEYEQEEIEESYFNDVFSNQEAMVLPEDRNETSFYTTQDVSKGLETNTYDEETGESQEEIIVLEIEEKEEENEDYKNYVKSVISAKKLYPISEETNFPAKSSSSSVETFASVNPNLQSEESYTDEEMDVVPELYSKVKNADVQSSESTEKFQSPVPSDVEEELEEEKRHSFPELNSNFQNKPPKHKPRALLPLSVNQEVLQVDETATSVTTPTDENFLENPYEHFIIISKSVNNDTQKKLDDVMDCLDEIKSCINEFVGCKQDEIYTGIYDNLIKSMFELNNVKSSNSEVINQKQNMLKIIHNLMSTLEEKVA